MLTTNLDYYMNYILNQQMHLWAKCTIWIDIKHAIQKLMLISYTTEDDPEKG
jgi:hypothetical protein